MVSNGITSISHLIDATELAGSLPEVLASVSRFIQGYGLDGYAYAELRPGAVVPCRLIHSNWLHEWCQRYRDKEYWLVDPLVPAVVKAGEVLAWSHFIDHARGVRPFFEDAARHHLVDGVTIPLHEPDRGVFSFSFSSSSGPFDHAALPLLRLAAVQAHGAAKRLLPPRNAKIAVKLTPRESQVLYWCASGKSTRDIAEILTIAESSVDWYFRCTFTKLGVSTRAAAVAKAMVLRLIDIETGSFFPLDSEG